MQLHGLHHVTSVTGNARGNVDFYTQTLGLRLVKKTVNQDDVSAYHLFYADKLGSPGTDITFFDWPQTGRAKRGTDSIVNTLFRVNGQDALTYWETRFSELQVKHEPISTLGNRSILRFEDPEGQRLALVDDGGAAFDGEVWDGAGIPAEYALRGFYGVMLSIQRLSQIEPILTRALNYTQSAQFPGTGDAGDSITLFSMDGGGPGKEVYVIEEPTARPAFLGSGGTHHVAFRVRDDEEQKAWESHLMRLGIPTSGVVDRYYFRSLYFRISNGILFELATDGPGFATDEPLETLGERLALPPFLEPQRARIEAGLKPI